MATVGGARKLRFFGICKIRRARKHLRDAGAGRTTADKILSPKRPPHILPPMRPDALRRTKTVATLGAAADSAEMLGRLIQAGVNVFRLNMSHAPSDCAGSVERSAGRFGRMACWV